MDVSENLETRLTDMSIDPLKEIKQLVEDIIKKSEKEEDEASSHKAAVDRLKKEYKLRVPKNVLTNHQDGLRKESTKVYVTFEGCYGNLKADGWMLGVYLKLDDAKQDLYNYALANIDDYHSSECLSPKNTEECFCSRHKSSAKKEILLGSMSNQQLYSEGQASGLLSIKEAFMRNCPQGV